MRFFGVFFVMALALVVFHGGAVQGQRMVAEVFATSHFYFVTPVEIVNEDTGTSFRLLGLMNPAADDDGAAVKALNEAVSGEVLSCMWHDPSKTIAWCNYGEAQNILTELVLDMNFAEENCTETGGQFGRCD